MGTENETTGTTNGDGKKKRKTREARPLWLLLPVAGTQTYEVFVCKGASEARKLLQDKGIDQTDQRLKGIKLLRGDEISLTISSQVVIKFGKVGDEAGEAEHAGQ